MLPRRWSERDDGVRAVTAADLGSDVLQEFCGAVGIARGVAVGELGNGEHVGESRFGGGVVEVVASYDGDDGRRRGTQCDRGGQLAVQGLVVEPSFAGDDQVGVGDVPVEVQQVQEVLGARGGGGTEKHGCEADPAGGPGSGGVGEGLGGARRPSG